jgi:VanZ family protein
MAIAVFVGADYAGEAGLFPGPWLDKIAHAVYYGTMALLLDHGLGQRSPVTAIVLAALVGVADERHQLGVVGRDASWQDAVADLLGALTAVASRRAFVRRG